VEVVKTKKKKERKKGMCFDVVASGSDRVVVKHG
jgi:hypothetical protein